METNGRKITAKVEPSSIHTAVRSRAESRAASPVVTLPPVDTNDSTSPPPASVRPKAKLTSGSTAGLKPPAKPTVSNASGRKTPASSTVSRGPRDRPVSMVGTPSKSPFGRPITPVGPPSKRAASPLLRTGPRVPSPSRSGAAPGTPRTTRPTVKPTSPPVVKNASSKSIPSRRTQPPPPPTAKRTKSPVRAPSATLPRRAASPTRSSLFEAPGPSVHRRVASASASSSVVSGGGDPSPSPGDLARARHKLPSSLSSITLPPPTITSSAPASPPSSTYPASVSSASLPTLNNNQSDPQDSSPEWTDLSAPPSAIPPELLSTEEPKRAIVSAPVTPVHVQTRVEPTSDPPVFPRPRTSSVTIVAGGNGDVERPRVGEPLAVLSDNVISTSKDSPTGIRIKAKVTATTPPNNPAARTIAHIRPEQLVVPRQRSGSISAGSSFSGLATSTMSRASSVRVTSASRILSPPLLRPGPGLGLIVPGANILIPPGMRSPPTSILSFTSSRTTSSSGSDSSAPATSIDRARTPKESGLRPRLTGLPSKLAHAAALYPPDEESVDRDDSGIDMFEADDAEQDQREEARSNRKIADLEISNKSLLAINATLEATKSRQAKEIRDLRRKLRESRLILPPSKYLALEQQDPTETKGISEEEEEEEEDPEEGDVTQTQADETYNRVRGLLDRLLKDGEDALKAKPAIPEEPDEMKKPIRVLDVDELQQYADRDIDELTESRATESVTDLAESIDEDSPSALAEKEAALATPKHPSSFSVGIFSGWGSR